MKFLNDSLIIIPLLTKALSMNFTLINRNSNAGPIYTDRPSYSHVPHPESWKKPVNEPLHLNPSKSKLNIRNSLNKTGENISLSNHNIDNVKGSCFLNNPVCTYQHIKRESVAEQKNFRSVKESNDISFELTSKDSFYKYSTVTPTSTMADQESKKGDLSFLRASLKEGCTLRMDDDSLAANKDNKLMNQLRGQILSLTKRVFINEQQIAKLKDKKDKQKKIQALQQQFTQFQIQMFDILKKNSNFFSDFQSKLQKNSNMITEMRERVFVNSDREQIIKKISQCQMKINEIHQGLKMKDELNFKHLTSQLNIQQNNLKSNLNEMIGQLKLRLDKNSTETSDIILKLSKLELEFKQKEAAPSQYIRDVKKCYNPFMVQTKQILVFKQADVIRDRTKQYLNNDSTPRKLPNQNILKIDTPRSEYKQYNMQSKREFVIKQKIYYIDSQGYLLDENKYYLLNSNNQQILIPDHLLNCLRQHNMLVNPAATLSGAIQQRR